eukprot:g11847.t1
MFVQKATHTNINIAESLCALYVEKLLLVQSQRTGFLQLFGADHISDCVLGRRIGEEMRKLGIELECRDSDGAEDRDGGRLSSGPSATTDGSNKTAVSRLASPSTAPLPISKSQTVAPSSGAPGGAAKNTREKQLSSPPAKDNFRTLVTRRATAHAVLQCIQDRVLEILLLGNKNNHNQCDSCDHSNLKIEFDLNALYRVRRSWSGLKGPLDDACEQLSAQKSMTAKGYISSNVDLVDALLLSFERNGNVGNYESTLSRSSSPTVEDDDTFVGKVRTFAGRGGEPGGANNSPSKPSNDSNNLLSAASWQLLKCLRKAGAGTNMESDPDLPPLMLLWLQTKMELLCCKDQIRAKDETKTTSEQSDIRLVRGFLKHLVLRPMLHCCAKMQVAEFKSRAAEVALRDFLSRTFPQKVDEQEGREVEAGAGAVASRSATTAAEPPRRTSELREEEAGAVAKTKSVGEVDDNQFHASLPSTFAEEIGRELAKEIKEAVKLCGGQWSHEALRKRFRPGSSEEITLLQAVRHAQKVYKAHGFVGHDVQLEFIRHKFTDRLTDLDDELVRTALRDLRVIAPLIEPSQKRELFDATAVLLERRGGPISGTKRELLAVRGRFADGLRLWSDETILKELSLVPNIDTRGIIESLFQVASKAVSSENITKDVERVKRCREFFHDGLELWKDQAVLQKLEENIALEQTMEPQRDRQGSPGSAPTGPPTGLLGSSPDINQNRHPTRASRPPRRGRDRGTMRGLKYLSEFDRTDWRTAARDKLDVYNPKPRELTADADYIDEFLYGHLLHHPRIEDWISERAPEDVDLPAPVPPTFTDLGYETSLDLRRKPKYLEEFQQKQWERAVLARKRLLGQEVGDEGSAGSEWTESEWIDGANKPPVQVSAEVERVAQQIQLKYQSPDASSSSMLTNTARTSASNTTLTSFENYVRRSSGGGGGEKGKDHPRDLVVKMKVDDPTEKQKHGVGVEDDPTEKRGRLAAQLAARTSANDFGYRSSTAAEEREFAERKKLPGYQTTQRLAEQFQSRQKLDRQRQREKLEKLLALIPFGAEGGNVSGAKAGHYRKVIQEKLEQMAMLAIYSTSFDCCKVGLGTAKIFEILIYWRCLVVGQGFGSEGLSECRL